MKTNFIVLLLIMTTVLSAKEIVVEATRKLNGNLEEPSFFPSYSADGNSIYFTGNAYTGLWSMDRSSFEASMITDVPGAGFQPISLTDGSIVFRQDEFISGRKYTSLFRSSTKGIHRLIDQKRFLSTTGTADDQIITRTGNDLVMLDGPSESRVDALPAATALINADLGLKLLQNGILKDLEPLGNANYIWGQLSPQKELIVFTGVGRGTFICDLDGKLITDLGLAHVPQWSPDGHFLVFMKDLDDGHQFTESEIWISSVDGSQAWMITDTPNRIEMYPQWSPSGKQIIYHSPQGEIFETTISIID